VILWFRIWKSSYIVGEGGEEEVMNVWLLFPMDLFMYYGAPSLFSLRFLYEIFSNPSVIKYRIPVLITSHKNDLPKAWKAKEIQNALEKEM
jgi:hypothetical protein